MLIVFVLVGHISKYVTQIWGIRLIANPQIGIPILTKSGAWTRVQIVCRIFWFFQSKFIALSNWKDKGLSRWISQLVTCRLVFLPRKRSVATNYLTLFRLYQNNCVSNVAAFFIKLWHQKVIVTCSIKQIQFLYRVFVEKTTQHLDLFISCQYFCVNLFQLQRLYWKSFFFLWIFSWWTSPSFVCILQFFERFIRLIRDFFKLFKQLIHFGILLFYFLVNLQILKHFLEVFSFKIFEFLILNYAQETNVLWSNKDSSNVFKHIIVKLWDFINESFEEFADIISEFFLLSNFVFIYLKKSVDLSGETSPVFFLTQTVNLRTDNCQMFTFSICTKHETLILCHTERISKSMPDRLNIRRCTGIVFQNRIIEAKCFHSLNGSGALNFGRGNGGFGKLYWLML